MTRAGALLLPLLLAGCTTALGPVGAVQPESDPIGVKMLRPGVTGRSCATSVVGVRLSGNPPTLREALDQITALDAEGDVVVNAEVSVERLVTGLYDRRCIAVRGDLARTIPTITLPGHVH
jgi:hypothetical protein